MTSYILLAVIIIIVILGIIRASKQPKVNRKKRSRAQQDSLLIEKNQSTQANERLITHSHQPTHATSNNDALVDDDNQNNEEQQEDRINVEQSTPTEQPHQTQFKNDVATKPVPRRVKNEIITITLRAEDNKFYKGYELLQALLTSGMRYSRQGIFHRYTKLIKRDEILFSLISGVAPGTFDLPKMGAFSSPALTLFMQTADVEDAEQTYNMMVATAQELTDALGGILLDEKKVPLTAEKIAFWRERLKNTEAIHSSS